MDFTGELMRHLDKHNVLLIDAYRSMSHKVRTLQDDASTQCDKIVTECVMNRTSEAINQMGDASAQSNKVVSECVINSSSESVIHEDDASVQCDKVVSECVTNYSGESVIHEDDASTQSDKVVPECGTDYSSVFSTKEIFKSREALIQWAREVGRRNGFVIVIKTSDGGGNGKRPRVTLSCERGGRYRNTRKKEAYREKKWKRTGTKKCGCPFALKGQKLDTDDDWMLQVISGVHNHPAAEQLVGHSYAGRLSKEETSLLVDLSKNMVRPKEILVTLKQRDAFNATTLKTIYNARHRYKVLEKAERSQIQQLVGGGGDADGQVL